MKRILSVLAVLIFTSITAQAQNLSSATCPGTGCIDIQVSGQGSIAIQVSGTWMGTITFKSSVNNTTFADLSCVSTANTDRDSVTTTTGNGIFQCTITGFSLVRVQMTSYTSGTAVITNRTTNAAAKFSSPSGSGGAPTDAEYWVGAANGDLSAEKNLGALSTGLVINTSGTPSAYAGASCGGGQVISALSASGVATCASPAGGITQIATASPTGTNVVSFTSISGSYSGLMIIANGRATTAGTGSSQVLMTFNSDTGNNYSYEVVYGLGSGTAAAGNSNGVAAISVGELPTAGDVADMPGFFTATLPFYANTTFNKAAISQGGFYNNSTAGSLLQISASGSWDNTAAITRIDLTLSSGNWVTGSQVNLYGIQ